MRIKLYFSIVCLFTSFSSFTDTSNKLTFSLWSKPDIEIFYSLPMEVNEDTKVLFVIHGASRGAKSNFTKWYEYTKNKNIILDLIFMINLSVSLYQLETKVKIQQ